MLSDSPPERDLEWTDAGAAGAARFIQRIWKMFEDSSSLIPPVNTKPPQGIDRGPARELRAATHRTIEKVTRDIEGFKFNVAVAQIHEYANTVSEALSNQAGTPELNWAIREALETLAILVAPMMPHLAEEVWSSLGHTTLIAETPWCIHNPELSVQETITIGIQVNGKLRGTIDVPVGLSEKELKKLALEQTEFNGQERIINAIGGKPIRKVVVVPNRIVSLVV